LIVKKKWFGVLEHLARDFTFQPVVRP